MPYRVSLAPSNAYTKLRLVQAKKMMRSSLIFILTLWAWVYGQSVQSEQTGSWSRKAFQEIQPWELTGRLSGKETKALRRIPLEAFTGKELVVVVGFWCSDSENWIPVLLKGLENFPNAKVVFYALDRKKMGGEDWKNSLKITLLPTFIVIANGLEKGRIEETPASGILWKDLGELLKN
jgi:thiol-disulfide isomerase/thioredoxin